MLLKLPGFVYQHLSGRKGNIMSHILTPKKFNKFSIAALVSAVLFMFGIGGQALAATSPGLGQADSFAILAGTAVTNVPTSVISGNVGLSPAAGSNYAGLSSSEVTGTIYAVDASGPAGSVNNPAFLTAAKTDLVTAYNGLAGGANADANCNASYQFGTGNKDLSGASLVPGVYCADTFTLTGTLTLTGSGVWVFRSAATLVTSGTANIVGGDPCNIWWQIPSSATLGTNTSLKGNILALSSITMTTGASLNGRILARNAAVTLNHNTITNAACTDASAASAAAAAASSTTSTTSTSATVTAKLPNTGIAPKHSSNALWAIAPVGMGMALSFFYLSRKKRSL